MRVSAIDCDYLDDYDRRRQHQGIPPDLAALIARKAAALRANLARRKAQKRARVAAGHPDDDTAAGGPAEQER